MPKGPRGERQLGDVVGAAVMVAKIVTGEIEENTGQYDGKDNAAVEPGGRAARHGQRR